MVTGGCITKEMINEKHSIPYRTVKRLERNAYLRGYRAGVKKGKEEAGISEWYTHNTREE